MSGASSNRKVVAWAFYDWANSAFATTVMAGFFPVFFKDYWSGGADASTSTFRLGTANSLSSAIIVLLAPVLGAIADAARRSKSFLMFFSALGALATGLLYLVPQGAWLAAAALYVLASLGFMGGNVFYDALLVGVAEESRRDRASALGYALGYLGGGLLFAVQVAMTLKPALFGLSGPAIAVRISFLMVAVWWALFSVPLFVAVEEPRLDARRPPPGRAMLSALIELKKTFHEVRTLRVAFLFLLAYWLYIDGVDTVIRMAVDYGMSIGLATKDLIAALLITQFVGFPAAIVFGRLGERLGAKRALFGAIFVYVIVTAWAAFMDSAREFYGLAAVVGLVQGGIQALSRSLYARLIPAQRANEFFGFYNMLGKFAAIIGPLLVGTVSLMTGSPRASMLAILILFVAGASLLARVDVEHGARIARELEAGAPAQ